MLCVFSSCRCPDGYTGVHCEKAVDGCAGQPCSERGVCVDTRPGFVCVCSLGFEGPLCQAETDECGSSPCAGGATCVDLIGGYRCRCPLGFEGTRPHAAIPGLFDAISRGNPWTDPARTEVYGDAALT